MRLRTFGLFAAILGAILFVSFAILQLHRSSRSEGLDVLLLKDAPGDRPSIPANESIIVRLDAHRRWSLNDRRGLSRDELNRLLQTELCNRVERIVMFEADPELTYGDALQAMDSLHAVCNAKVVLLTPNSRPVDSNSQAPPAKNSGDKSGTRVPAPEQVR